MLDTDTEFTGLLDKHGYDICENDHINISFGKEDRAKGIRRTTYENVQVVWHKGRLQWCVTGGNVLYEFASLGPDCYVNPEYEKINPRRQA